MAFSLSPLIVCSIIVHTREFHSKDREDVVILESINEPSEKDFMQIFTDHQNDLTCLALKETIDNLELDQPMQVVALIYLGPVILTNGKKFWRSSKWLDDACSRTFAFQTTSSVIIWRD